MDANARRRELPLVPTGVYSSVVEPPSLHNSIAEYLDPSLDVTRTDSRSPLGRRVDARPWRREPLRPFPVVERRLDASCQCLSFDIFVECSPFGVRVLLEQACAVA